MTSELEVTWLEVDGELAAWETQHLFGYDLCFGKKNGRVLIPVRFTQLSGPTTPFERRRIRSALFQWGAGDWAGMTTVLQDLAAGG